MANQFSQIAARLADFFNTWRSYFALQACESQWQQIVFYAESSADWANIEPVLKLLNEKHHQKVTCVTSDPADPILANTSPLIRSFYIGSGTARTVFFKALQARAMVMTLSDLNSYFLKRSVNPVHYFYVFHALVSTHAAYRQHAFDSYDTVFCVGPHHIHEIREQEKVYNLQPKNLLEGGYCRLDQLIAEIGNKACSQTPVDQMSPTVLVAPTWGASSMVESCLLKVLDTLTKHQIRTILRLHPMTLRHYPGLPGELQQKYQHTGCFEFDSRQKSIESLLQADIMVADHGGSGIEYAFGLEKPVIWVSTPPKIHNPGRDRINLPLFEDSIRSQTGIEISTDCLDQLPDAIKSLYPDAETWKKSIASLREKSIFNVGRSAEVMADAIYDHIANPQKGVQT